MTAIANRPSEAVKREDLITLTIDDIDVSVPKGTLVIRAAELIGVEIPRFCDHPLLSRRRVPAVPGRGARRRNWTPHSQTAGVLHPRSRAWHEDQDTGHFSGCR